MEALIAVRKKEFWGQERFHDISFSFPDDEKVLRANKTILALISPVFEAMFFGELAEKRNPIPILDVDSNVFEDFLKYIYTEEFLPESIDDALNLFYVAHKYEVTTIEASCEQYLVKNLTRLNANELLGFAETFVMQNLLALCRLYVDNNPRTDLPVTWVKWKKGDPLPSTTVFAEIDPETNWPIGIARFVHNNRSHDLLPGPFYIKELVVRAPWGFKTYMTDDDFEILCNGDLKWHQSRDGETVEKAVIGGLANSEDELFIGKVEYAGEMRIGKIHPRYNQLYIPYFEREISFTEYFILLDMNDGKTIKPKSDLQSPNKKSKISGSTNTKKIF